MTTRLTKDTRAEIVNSALAATDLQEQRKKIEDATSELAAQLSREAQPEGWFELIADSPIEWFKLDSSIYLSNSINPLTALSGNWGGRVNYNAPVPVAIPLRLTDEAATKAFAKLHKQAAVWRETYDATHGELTAFLRSCSTVEKVIERMPELAKHVPKATESFPLVAPSNVLSRLAKLGFDRSMPT